ncbi:MAG: YihA family ribosome biogenesis GTP-binding protein [Acidobacteriota bacterium]|nr:MAG: YihA family ribosome biogenesis GTP-binding protein [Acidobacteriota bacterium]
MRISNVRFIKSAFKAADHIRDGKPEIAFLGRSNVGKSSLINSLLQRKGLAKTSNTPGRTQAINYFEVNDSFYFVDLPGYGYAKVSKTMRQDWGKMAESYLSDSDSLVLNIQLIDSRHGPTPLDLQLFEWLRDNDKPNLVVATKADKISRNELTTNLAAARKAMPDANIIAYSSKTGTGRDDIWSHIENSIAQWKK